MLSFQPARLSSGLLTVSTSPFGHSRSSLKQGADQVCFGSTDPQNALEDWATAEKRLAGFYEHHCEQAPQIEKYLKTLFPPALGTLVFRTKTPESFWHKAERVYKAKNKVSFDPLQDCIGARLVLKEGSGKELEQVVKKLVKALKNKEIELLSLANSFKKYQSDYLYYFHPDIHSADLEKHSKYKLTRFRRPDDLESGSVFVNMVFRKSSQSTEEQPTYFSLQLCGPEVHPLMEIDHLFYAVVIKGKKLPSDLADIELRLKGLTDSQKSSYANYLRGWYRYARKVEQEFYLMQCRYPPSQWVSLGQVKKYLKAEYEMHDYPNSLPPELKVENLAKRLAARDPELARWIEGNPLFEDPPDPTIVPLT